MTTAKKPPEGIMTTVLVSAGRHCPTAVKIACIEGPNFIMALVVEIWLFPPINTFY